MTNDEMVDAGIWAGGGLGVMIITVLVIGMLDGNADARADEAEDLYDAYQAQYLEVTDGQPSAAFREELTAVLQRQQADLATAEELVVYPGNRRGLPEEFVDVRFTVDLGDGLVVAPMTTNDAIGISGRVRDRLAGQLNQRGVLVDLQDLPFRDSEVFHSDNTPNRVGSIARLCAYTMLMDLAIECGFESITAVDVEPTVNEIGLLPGHTDASGRYQVINVAVSGTVSYAGADRLLQAITDRRNGLTLQHFSLAATDQSAMAIDVVAGLVVPTIPGLEMPIFGSNAGSVQASSGGQRGTRATRGTRTVRSSAP